MPVPCLRIGLISISIAMDTCHSGLLLCELSSLWCVVGPFVCVMLSANHAFEPVGERISFGSFGRGFVPPWPRRQAKLVPSFSCPRHPRSLATLFSHRTWPYGLDIDIDAGLIRAPLVHRDQV